MSKILLKIAMFLSTWDSLLELLLKFALDYLADIVKDKITGQGKDAVKVFYVLSKTLGARWARDTKSTVDDTLVNQVNLKCEEIANEAGFRLPTIY